MLRAYDKATGKEVGAVYMPAPQSGSPMTYMLNGKQYIVVAIGGAGLQRRTARVQARSVVMRASAFIAGVVFVAAAAALAASDRVSAANGDIEITPIIHSSLQIEYGGLVIQVDPWSAGDLSGAKPADLILITDDPGPSSRRQGDRTAAQAGSADRDAGVREGEDSRRDRAAERRAHARRPTCWWNRSPPTT